MDTDENSANFYNLNEASFPLVLKAPNNERHEIASWQDFAEFLDRRPAGVSALAHLRRFHVEGERKPISFSSLLSPLIYPYVVAYTQAIAKYQRGFLFAGGFEDQPNVLLQAFALIEGEVARMEQAQIKLMRRNQKEAAERARHG